MSIQTLTSAVRPQKTPGLAPGLALCAAIAAGAYALRAAPGLSLFSPMILAIALGAAGRNFIWTPPAAARPGLAFAMRKLLRFAIVLLGLQLTFAQVGQVGVYGIGTIALSLAATFVFTVWLGRRLGVERGLAELIAAGSSICGASAVAAANAATGAREEDVAYAVACVTLFGTVAMFAYPPLGALLGLDAHGLGLWAGASIHEVAQVVAAAFQHSREAGEFGVVAKLARVMMLAPVVSILSLLAARRRREQGADAAVAAPLVPSFLLGFVGMVALNSVVDIPAEAKAVITPATTVLLTIALAAMGLETDFVQLRARGLRPFLLGLAASLFIAAFSLILVMARP